MNKSIQHINSGFYQRGAATLLIALVILTTITMISIYTSRTVIMEQKITANDYRGRMAFEAAETGIDAAIAAINEGWTRTADTDNDGIPELVATNVVFDADGDLTAANNLNTLTLDSGSNVSVTLTELSDAAELRVSTQIVAVGRSDDNVATRTITQVVTIISALPNIPENPLLTRGTAVISGSADVYNPEGHSTIWSGGAVDLGGSATVNTWIANPADPNYPDCLGDSDNPCDTIASSTSAIAGLDVIEQDSSLANLTEDEFFENFFGMTPTEYRNEVVTMELDGVDIDDAHLVTNEVIWVEGDATLSANKVVGCLVDESPCTAANIEPVVLIVNGTLTLQGNADFYGLLYVMNTVEGHGNPYSVGSIVVAGQPSDLTGSFEVHYNSGVLETLATDSGRPASGGGSWRDFN